MDAAPEPNDVSSSASALKIDIAKDILHHWGIARLALHKIFYFVVFHHIIEIKILNNWSLFNNTLIDG